MDLSYFQKPYEFIPPNRRDAWCHFFRWQVRPRLRWSYGIHALEFQGLEHLRRSLERGAGILLVPNHCRYADPPVLGALGLTLNQYFYYAASWHLFMQGRYVRWALPRIGAFSVFREGADRDMIREATRILAEAERPIVLFPEGTFYRQNDRLGPLQEGLGFIARRAADGNKRPIDVLPVALKYWFLDDPWPALDARIGTLERLFHFTRPTAPTPTERLERVIEAVIAIREIEHLGRTQAGELAERIERLRGAILATVETRVFGQTKQGPLMERVRAVRQTAVRELRAGSRSTGRMRDLDDLVVCQQIISHDLDYLRVQPSAERVAETTQRLEEDMRGVERPVAPMGVVARVLPPLESSAFPQAKRGAGDPLLERIERDLQAAIDALVAEGPPAAWRNQYATGTPTPVAGA